jgi:hypothetical protein
MGILHHSCYSVTRSRTLVNFKEIIVHFSHHFQPLLGTRYLTFTPPDSDNTRAKGQKLAAVLNGLRSLREKEQNLYCESTYISKTINCISIYTHNKIKFLNLIDTVYYVWPIPTLQSTSTGLWPLGSQERTPPGPNGSGYWSCNTCGAMFGLLHRLHPFWLGI